MYNNEPYSATIIINNNYHQQQLLWKQEGTFFSAVRASAYHEVSSLSHHMLNTSRCCHLYQVRRLLMVHTAVHTFISFIIALCASKLLVPRISWAVKNGRDVMLYCSAIDTPLGLVNPELPINRLEDEPILRLILDHIHSCWLSTSAIDHA